MENAYLVVLNNGIARNKLNDVKFKEGTSVAQSILKYIVNHKEIASAIPAMNSVDEMKENLGILEDMSMNWLDIQLLEEAEYTSRQLGAAYLPRHYRWLHDEWTV